MIEVKHLEKEFNGVKILEDVNAVINDGDVISVIGPSGAGKSTFLRCINLLSPPTAGQIFLDGQEITDREYDVNQVHMKVGMVFQSFNLFGHLTVIENIMLAPTKLLKKSRQEAYDNGMELLKRVGLAEKALSYPDQLSGGQKQRVAIARTLAMDPEVILLDEPTSALDPTMVGEVQSVIRDLAGTGKTMMIVTHEMKFARAISNKIFYMDEGGLYEEGTPDEIFENPKRELTQRFIKQLKVLRFNIDSPLYDFQAAASEIDRYCSTYDIVPKLKYHIHLVFEELVQQILIPTLTTPNINVGITYNEDSNTVNVEVLYNGDKFNPQDSRNQLALTMLNSTITDFKYEEIEQSDYTNKVSFSIVG